jgi:purine catabolism regulator
LRLLAPARRVTLRGDATSLELRVVLAAGDDDPGGLALADRIGRFLGRTVALSRAFSDPGDRPSAEAEARSTLEAARAVGEPIGVARADRLAAYRLLGALHNLPDGLRQARALLEPLLGGRPDVRAERLATLRAILDHPGSAEAAASLGIHRNTVAYRVRRMEAASGWSLDDPDLRLALSVAVRLVQTALD